MEIEGGDGIKIQLQNGIKTVFGRGQSYSTKDKTVARQHVVFHLKTSSNSQTQPRVSFEVIGKNPLWLRSKDGRGRWNVKAFRRFERGEMAAGDWFCVSSQYPVWFSVKCRSGVGDSELSDNFEDFDVSEIDPVQEFGFLVVGHEFDSYPKQRIRNVNNWDWFLEETERDSEGDESFDVKKNRKRKKKKKSGENNDDEDWTGESEEDKEIVSSSRKVGRAKYETRSRDKKKPSKRSKMATSFGKKREISRNEDVEEDEEDNEDDTLGGFIVDDNEDEEEQILESDDEEDEEEEFVDDDEDELDD